jgi:hypothetical protein
VKARAFLASALVLLASAAARADTGFFGYATTGFGGGFYHYYEKGGLGNQGGTYGGFSLHVALCGGAHFGPVGIGIGSVFEPLINPGGGFAPGGFGGACVAVRPIDRVQIDVIAGFGGMGVSKVFGGIGPSLAPGVSFDIIKLDKLRVNVGVRIYYSPYSWQPDSAIAWSGTYFAPTAGAGIAYW